MLAILAAVLALAVPIQAVQARMAVMEDDDLSQVQAQLGASLILQARTTTGYLQMNSSNYIRLSAVQISGNGTVGTPGGTADGCIGYESTALGGPALLDFYTRTNDPPAYIDYSNYDPPGNMGTSVNPPLRSETVVRLLFPSGYSDTATTPDLYSPLIINGTTIGNLRIRDLYQQDSRMYLYVPQTTNLQTLWLDSEWEFDITEISISKGAGQGMTISHLFINQTPVGANTSPTRGTGRGRIGRPERGATIDVYTTGGLTTIFSNFTIQGTIRAQNISLGGVSFGPLVLDYINTDPSTGNWLGGGLEVYWNAGATFISPTGGTMTN